MTGILAFSFGGQITFFIQALTSAHKIYRSPVALEESVEWRNWVENVLKYIC